MPTSRAQTEPKGSEYTPPDTSEPLRTTGGGCRAELDDILEIDCKLAEVQNCKKNTIST